MSLLKNLFDSSKKRDKKSTMFKSIFEHPTNIELKELKLEDLTDKEKDFIKTYSSLLEDSLILLGVLKEKGKTKITPEIIDKGIEVYFTYENELKIDLDNSYDKISNVLSAGWGQYLVDTFNMEWWVITDDWGTEIGVYYNNKNEKKEINLFPFQLVNKAIQHKYDTYLTYMTEEVKKMIELK